MHKKVDKVGAIFASRIYRVEESRGGNLSAEIHQPVKVDDLEWTCMLRFSGAREKTYTLHGVDAFQALSQAIKLHNSWIVDLSKTWQGALWVGDCRATDILFAEWGLR